MKRFHGEIPRKKPIGKVQGDRDKAKISQIIAAFFGPLLSMEDGGFTSTMPS